MAWTMEEQIQTILKARSTVASIKDVSRLNFADWVMVGPYRICGCPDRLHLARVAKIDLNLIVTLDETDSPVTRFSGKKNLISTKSFAGQDWAIYDIQKSYDLAVWRIELDRANDTRFAHNEVQSMVSGLNPIDDADLLQKIRSLIEDYKNG